MAAQDQRPFPHLHLGQLHRLAAAPVQEANVQIELLESETAALVPGGDGAPKGDPSGPNGPPRSASSTAAQVREYYSRIRKG